MCEECWIEENPDGVVFTRRYPKNKVGPDTTPAQYLEGWDIARGMYDKIDQVYVYETDINDAGRPGVIAGFYDTYRGIHQKRFSSPMFTFRDAGQDCQICAEIPEDQRQDHPEPAKRAQLGCECGNIAFFRECPDHPLPSAESRWVKVGQTGIETCSMCRKLLKATDEVFNPARAWFCSIQCQIAYDDRQARRRKQYESGLNRS